MPRRLSLSLSLFLLCGPALLQAQEEDLRFQVLDIKGMATIYRDEIDDTSRLHKGGKADDGDQIITSPKSEVVLRLKGRGYVRLSSNTKATLSRLRTTDRGVQCRINLVYGRLLVQLDKPQTPHWEITAAEMTFRGHGTLFEAYRRREQIQLTSYEGVMVANFPSTSKIVNAGQIMRIEGGKFRYKRYLKAEEKDRLQAWRDRLAELHPKKKKTRRKH